MYIPQKLQVLQQIQELQVQKQYWWRFAGGIFVTVVMDLLPDGFCSPYRWRDMTCIAWLNKHVIDVTWPAWQCCWDMSTRGELTKAWRQLSPWQKDSSQVREKHVSILTNWKRDWTLTWRATSPRRLWSGRVDFKLSQVAKGRNWTFPHSVSVIHHENDPNLI